MASVSSVVGCIGFSILRYNRRHFATNALQYIATHTTFSNMLASFFRTIRRLVHSLQVVEQEMKDVLLSAMADHYCLRILRSTMKNDKSVEQLSSEEKIPISTCYLRVNYLVQQKLLRKEQTILTSDGKKFVTFKSCIVGATVNVASGNIDLEVTLDSKPPEEKLSTMWSIIRGQSTQPVQQGTSMT